MNSKRRAAPRQCCGFAARIARSGFLTTSRFSAICAGFIAIFNIEARDLAYGPRRHRRAVKRSPDQKTQRATVVQGALTMKTFARFMNDESGATAIEYGLIAASISIAIIVAITTVGSNLNLTFTNVSNALK